MITNVMLYDDAVTSHRIESHSQIISSSEIGVGSMPCNDHFGSGPDMLPRRIVTTPFSALELKDWITTLKKRCVGCGEPDPIVLVFHHLDRTEKFMGISEMGSRRFTKPEILNEVKKCAVLCCNCHARSHAE